MIVVHLLIFAACLIGAFEVSRSYVALIRLKWRTRIAAKVFFASTGIIHIGLALGDQRETLFQILYVLELVSVVVFLISLFIDLSSALRRLRLAFKVIEQIYGTDGRRMIATVIAALQGSKYKHDDPVDNNRSD